MKNSKIILMIIVAMMTISNVKAQDQNNPWAIGLGINTVDFYPANIAGMVNENGNSTQWFDEFFNANDHYNIIPSISKVSVTRYIENGFSLELAGTLNQIKKIGDNSVNDLSYYAIDASIKYSFSEFFETGKFEPIALLGGGYTTINSKGAGTFNAGLGLNYWFTDVVGVNIQSIYKHNFDDVNVLQHFQHSFGVVIKFGGTDSDGDGIFDKDDMCPDIFGLEEFNGCPDTDGDGIIDSEDACPDKAGTANMNGCPDFDNDGVADNKDNCPNVVGPDANEGCPWPDTDGDSVLDKDDKCINVAGSAANGGCPWPDTDGDGVLDKDDNCISEAGLASNNGCPLLPNSVKEVLNSYAKTITFDSSRTTIKDASANILNNIIAILNDYPNAKFNIEGHTDSTGPEGLNQKLSEGRAKAVLNYLTSNGIDASRLNAKGYGESRPIQSNNISSGRRANRRVEINLNK